MSVINRSNPSQNLKASQATGYGLTGRGIAGSSLRRIDDFSAGLTWIMTFIAGAGLCLSTYLSWVSLTSSKIAGCGGGQIFDCSHVMNTKWSSAFGIPVGVPAAGLYLALVTALLVSLIVHKRSVRHFAMSLVTVGALSAGMAAIWFISLQVFVVEHLCSYCLAAHTCGLLLSGIVLWKMPIGVKRTLAFSVLSFAGVAVLATSQVLAEKPIQYEIQTYPIEGASPAGSESSPFSAPGVDAPTDPVIDAPFAPPTDSLFEAPSDAIFEAPSDAVFEAPVQDSGQKQGARQSSTTVQTAAVLGAISWFTPQTSILVWQDPAQTKPAQTKPAQTEPAKQAEPAKQVAPDKLVSIAGGNIKLNAKHWPVVGSTDAKRMFVEMFDYTCPHCRANHKSVKQAMDQLGNEVAVMALAVPIDRNCNDTVAVTDPVHAEACEIAKLSVAVWRVNPAKFREYHEWLFTGDTAPSAASARLQAESMVGKAGLDAEMAKNIPSQYIAKHVEIYKRLGAGTVPKLLFPATSINGNVGSGNALIQIINQQLGQ